MGEAARSAKELMKSLPLPLRSTAPRFSPIKEAEQEFFHSMGTHHGASSINGWDGEIEFDQVLVGDLACIHGKATPMRLCLEMNDRISVGLNYWGTSQLHEEGRSITAHTGELLVFRNRGGTLDMSAGSGISFQLDSDRLLRTAAVISALRDHHHSTDHASSSKAVGAGSGKPLFSLFRFIDSLLAEDRSLPSAMGLDEQIYRLITILQLHWSGEQTKDALGRKPEGRAADHIMRELVDFIIENSSRSLTLTDLEEKSAYSGRWLQYMFAEKYHCTPMQFVRRQRLQAALQRLETATRGETISQIARECGYRQTAHFCSDFKKAFGHTPSDVLRNAGTRQD